MNEATGFSKREWFFIIFIIVLVQFIVQYSAFLYSGSSTALSYISFSGTIVSIILALLAIIYSYYQSASQANSSSSLNSQIDKLIGIVDTIKTNKADFSIELEQLSEIRDKIDSSMNLQRVSHAQVRELADTIEDLRDNNLSGVYAKENDGDYFSKLVVDGDNLIHLSLLIIHYAAAHGVELKNIWKELSRPTILALHRERATVELQEFYKGAISSVITVLKAFGYIEITGDDFPLATEDDFEEKLSGFRDFVSSRDDEDYKIIISTLDKVTA